MEKYDYIPKAMMECQELYIATTSPTNFWDEVDLEIHSPLTEHACKIEKYFSETTFQSTGASQKNKYIETEPTTTKAKKQKCEVFVSSRKKLVMNRETLRSLFRVKLSIAAEMFGVAETTFKGKCRELGVRHWPQRKLQGLDRLYKNVRDDYSKCERNSVQAYFYLDLAIWLSDVILKYETQGIETETRDEKLIVKYIRCMYPIKK